jgi:alkyl sulfatase BDS1-like metallo-beta-lactamase superfamily hydrolase
MKEAIKPANISPFARPTVETILASPPGTFIKLLEDSVDPERSAEVDAVVRLTFSDLNRSWAIRIRRGIAEVTEKVPEKVDASIELPRPVWAQISAGETNLEIAIYSGRVEFNGEPEALDAVMNCFEMV